ncbi:hypothetical protein D3C71_1997680 [compost metagenome]
MPFAQLHAVAGGVVRPAHLTHPAITQHALQRGVALRVQRWRHHVNGFAAPAVQLVAVNTDSRCANRWQVCIQHAQLCLQAFQFSNAASVAGLL